MAVLNKLSSDPSPESSNDRRILKPPRRFPLPLSPNSPHRQVLNLRPLWRSDLPKTWPPEWPTSVFKEILVREDDLAMPVALPAPIPPLELESRPADTVTGDKKTFAQNKPCKESGPAPIQVILIDAMLDPAPPMT